MRSLAIMLSAGWLTACSVTPVGGPDSMKDTSVEEFKRLCATKLEGCRGPHTVRLLKEDGAVHEISFEIGVPVVQGNLVTIFPGETIYLEADLEGDRVVRLRAVSEMVNPDRTMTFSFSQSEGETDMLFKASNPFPRPLKYRMGMERLDRDGLLSTSSCPIVAGGSAYEFWPHPIFQLVLTDFRLLDEDGSGFVCE